MPPQQGALDLHWAVRVDPLDQLLQDGLVFSQERLVLSVHARLGVERLQLGRLLELLLLVRPRWGTCDKGGRKGGEITHQFAGKLRPP